ncbi:family 16 glycosylhydrolase [Burkholderia sp. SRS-W-2-2016]|uniref:family 16 glycosylhydrolase n=1 Tax=Burkholderia sp. SRS-W-2-2016 TaxID=1926878 RepID=UPI00117DA065|nr:family 16 glycosylhydrolase [Burkholderia sp. SRS-W-2-2016]
MCADEHCIQWGAGGRSFADGSWHLRDAGRRFDAVDRAENMQLAATDATLQATRQDGKIYAAALTTAGRLSISAGSIEAVMTLCADAPVRGSVWLQSPENRLLDGGQPGPGAEIDVIELVGGSRPFYSQNLHFGGYGSGHVTRGNVVRISNTCSPHLYTASFGPDGYEFGIDRVRTWTDRQAQRSAQEAPILSIEYDRKLGPIASGGPDAVLGELKVTSLKVCGNWKFS